MPPKPSQPELEAELEALRVRLAGAEAVLHAIRDGEVDALVVTGEHGERVYALHRAYRQITETMSEGVVILSEDGIILYCNVRLAEMLVQPHGQVLGATLRNYLTPADQKALDAVLLQARTEPCRREINLKSCNGRLVPVYLSASRLPGDTAKIVFCLVMTDLTDQKSHERILASELRYRRLFESAKDGILILDAQTGRVMDVNPFLIELLGFSREDFLDKSVWDLGFFHDIAANEGKFAELRTKDYVRYADLPLKTADGRALAVEFVSNVYLVNEQKVIQCNIRDITASKQARAYHEMSTEIFELMNNSGDLLAAIQSVIATVKKGVGCDAVGLRLQDGEDFPYYAQQGFSGDFLLTENSLLERNAGGGVLRDRDGNVSLECTCGLVISGKTDAASPLFTKRGSFWTNDSLPLLELPPEKDPRYHPRNQCIHQGYASMALVPIRNQERIIGLLHLNARRKGCFSVETIETLEGIAEHIGAALMRKQAEDALRQSEQEFRSLAESMPQIVWVTRADGWNIYFNQQWLDYTGLTLEQSYGHGWNTPFHPDDKQRAWEAWQRATHHGDTYSVECRLRRADGAYRWWLIRGVPLRNAAGEILKWFGTCTDINDIKQAEMEREKLQAQFTQAQKMESVGRLAGGVAHDFNNMLMAIMGYTELCLDKIAPDHPIREWLNEITLGAARSAQLTRQLLAFARKQVIAPKVLDINDTISGMLKLLRHLIGEDIAMTWRPGAGVWPVKMDPTQIDQILANLVVNSRDAIGGAGSITIATSNATLDQSYCAGHPGSLPGNFVLLTVSDTGCGMPTEVLDHLFEPFFTTKGEGEGTGLGLATVYGIVKQNEGFINVDSEPGKGANFKIYLPGFVTAEAAQSVAPTPAPLPRGNETILIVEDEKSIRITTSILLETLGYTVLVAEDPEKALRVVAGHPGVIHLLITDVIMPGMSGRDLANRLLELRPTIKRLFISGFTADIIAQRGILDDGVNFLSKPFGRDQLARKVRELLEAKQSPKGGA